MEKKNVHVGDGVLGVIVALTGAAIYLTRASGKSVGSEIP